MFSDKRLRYGTFSTVMMLLAVVVFVFVNLLAGEFDRSADLTTERIFSLTEQTEDFLAELEDEITITLLSAPGAELPGPLAQVTRITNQLLIEYADASPLITTQTRDPMLNPGLIHRFAQQANIEGGISDHSIVVEGAGNIRIIPPYELIDFDFNLFTGTITRLTSFNIEREITRAIQGVTQGAPTIVYYVIGSGESPLHPAFVDFLEAENFLVRDVNLVIEDVPEDADIIFVPMPARDWTEHKSIRVLDFLEAEGNAFFALDTLPHVPVPNFDAVLDAYGIFITGDLIIEDSQNLFVGRTVYMIPGLVAHEITENLLVRNFANILPFLPAEIQVNTVRRASLSFQPLWMTSEDAFARSPLSEVETLARTPDDFPGPFGLAVAVTDRLFLGGNVYTTRMVVTTGGDFFDPHFNFYIGEGNWHFVLNSLRWMQEQPPGIFVPPRTPPGHMPLLITDGAANVISVAAIGGVPLVFIGIGTVVWFRRKNS